MSKPSVPHASTSWPKILSRRGPVRDLLDALLSAPQTGLPLDDARTIEHRASELRSRSKRFLRSIYTEWAERLAARLPAGADPVLEIGSGAGLLAERVPGLIRSDVLACPGLDLVMDARQLALGSGSLRAIVLCNVLHHIPDPRRFLDEAARCLRPGGAVLMIEPWVTPLASLVWRLVGHEPFDPGAGWEIEPGGGPLSGANLALPWILFGRDRARLEGEVPALRLRSLELLMPFRYLLSGGFSRRALVPAWTFSAFRALEASLSAWMGQLAMFAQIELVRRARSI